MKNRKSAGAWGIFPGLLFLLSFIFPWESTMAQQVDITGIELKGGDLHIHYNLIDEDLNRKYSLFLYTSRDNFIQPLKLVDGDIGVDQAIGGNKKAIWHAREEYGSDFSDDIAVEIKGNIYVPFVTLNEFEENKVLKRATPFQLTWAGGRGENVLSIELYKGDQKVHIFEERPNSGSTSLSIPSKIKPGNDYYFKISDKRNRDEIVYTSTFEVKRKIPQAYKIAGSFILGGLSVILINALIPEPDIPEPPLPNGG